ncbi:MAG TPA: YCF48-related protein [Chloroflexota bacterium]|nr:YCF48-related protein [Chloroflexota bacterium]
MHQLPPLTRRALSLLVPCAVAIASAGPATTRAYAATSQASSGATAGLRQSSASPYLPDLLDVTCPGPATCYAVGFAGTQTHPAILKTTDGGRSWRAQAPGTPWGLRGIACASASTCLAVGFAETTVRTTDGGAHWADPHTPTSPQPLIRVACPTALLCVAAGNAPDRYTALVHRLLVTTTGGRRWTAPHTPLDGTAYALNAVACPSAHVCYAAGNYGAILASHDGGRTWTRQRDPVADRSVPLTGISCATPDVCVAVGLSFLGQRLSGIVLMTRDGGRDWMDASAAAAAGMPWRAWGLGLSAVACPAAQTCVAVGPAGTAIQTRDGGRSWTDVGDTGRALNGVACHGPRFCVAVGNGGYIVVLPRHVQQAAPATATAVPASPPRDTPPPTPDATAAPAPPTATTVPASLTPASGASPGCSRWVVGGAWTFTAAATALIGSGSGPATLTQNGTTLGGSLTLAGTTYTLSGTIAGPTVTLTLSAPGMVDTTLSGTISADGATIDLGQGVLHGQATCATAR